MLTYFKDLTVNKDYLFKGKLYSYYTDEIKTVYEDLLRGGNQCVTREMAFDMWLCYRLLFDDDDQFTTKAVVEANPVICKQHQIVYAGPILF